MINRFAFLLLASCSPQVSPLSGGNIADHNPESLTRDKDLVTRVGLNIDKYSANNCSQVAIGGSTLVDSCHGWEVTDCGSLAFFRGIGVRQDTGKVVIYDKGQSVVDVSAKLDNAISEQFPSNEILHRRFVDSTCDPVGISVSVEGSIIAKGKNGAADPFTATVNINGTGKINVTGLRRRIAKFIG